MDIDTLIEKAGGISGLASAAKVKYPTIYDWKRTGFIPGRRAAQISRALDIPLEEVFTLIKPAPVEEGH